MADTNTGGTPTGEDQSVTDAPDASKEEEGAEGGDESEGAEAQDDGSEPPVRRSPDYYIGMRHAKKQAREQAREKAKEQYGDEEDEDQDGDVDMSTAISEAVKPIAQKLAQQEDEKELTTFLAGNPAFKPYEKKIRRFMTNETRAHLPITTIAMEAVGPDGMLAIGAKLARESDTKKSTSTSGPSGGREQGGKKVDVWNMPKEDFKKMQENIRHG